jgi:hypothetical protein
MNSTPADSRASRSVDEYDPVVAASIVDDLLAMEIEQVTA